MRDMGKKYKHKAEEYRKAGIPPKAPKPSKRETERILSRKAFELFAFPAMGGQAAERGYYDGRV